MCKWLNFKTKYTDKSIIKKDTSTYRSIFEFYSKYEMLLQNWDFVHNPL
jgi:hypothetical protein